MALCSYDNKVNQKYNIQKGVIMPVKKTEIKEDDKAQSDLNIVEALELAKRTKKMARRGWDNSLKNHFVTIRRGETKPSLSDGKHFFAFTPSIEDVMSVDWFELIENNK